MDNDNKETVADTLSKVTGLKKKDIHDIFEEVKANHAILDRCDIHNFEPLIEEEGKIPRKYVCSKCKGWVSSSNAQWYIKGINHANNSPGFQFV